MNDIAPGLRTFDAFPKVSSTYSIRSTRGGFVTILLFISCLFLFWIQLAAYIGGVEEQQFSVDKVVSQSMQINVDVTVAMPCEGITVDAYDQSQDRTLASRLLQFQSTDFEVTKHHRIGPQTEQDSFHGVLKRAKKSKFRKAKKTNPVGRACRIYGSMPITRVQGDLHITAKGYAYSDRQVLRPEALNYSHIIDEFSFGEFYPKLVNPLDSTASIDNTQGETNMKLHQYFLSIVPTTYISSTTGHVVETNQYAVTEQTTNYRPQVPPGIFFRYDIQPIRLSITDTRMPFTQWLVRLINILGGLVVCTGWAYKLGESMVGRLLGKKDHRTMLDTGFVDEK